MPLLDDAESARLLALAKIHRPCDSCGRHTALDYCRTCDEFFWHHWPGCMVYADHDGHRTVLTPFVEARLP